MTERIQEVRAPVFLAPQFAPASPDPVTNAWYTIGLVPLPPCTPRQEAAISKTAAKFTQLTESNRNLYFRFNLVIALQVSLIVLYGGALSQLDSLMSPGPALAARIALMLAGVLDILALDRSLYALMHRREVRRRAVKRNPAVAALESDPLEELILLERRTEQLDERIVTGRRRFAMSVQLTRSSLWTAIVGCGAVAALHPFTALVAHLIR